MEVTANEDFEKSTVYAFYREVAQRTLEAYLEPARAVMESLADGSRFNCLCLCDVRIAHSAIFAPTVRHWNSRLPASPISRLEGKPLQHVPAKTTSDKPGAEDKSPYWGKSVRFVHCHQCTGVYIKLILLSAMLSHMSTNLERAPKVTALSSLTLRRT